MLDHFEFCLLCHKTLMRKHSGGLDWTRTRSPPSKLDCKRARVWGFNNVVVGKIQECCLIYPNPTFGDALLKYKLAASDEYTFIISDLCGQILFIQDFKGDSMESKINTENMQSGLYLLSVFNGKLEIFQSRFVLLR